MTRAARSGLIVLELPADLVVLRRIAVPVQARAFLPGIVRNQIERLSPWHADQVVYGFDADVGEDAATLDVRVLIALRADLDRARDELAAIGLPVGRIVTRQLSPSLTRPSAACGGGEGDGGGQGGGEVRHAMVAPCWCLAPTPRSHMPACRRGHCRRCCGEPWY